MDNVRFIINWLFVAFVDNLPINFREKGQVVSTNPDDDEHLEETKKRAFIVSDITTTFTFFVAIFFPSVTGMLTNLTFSPNEDLG